MEGHPQVVLSISLFEQRGRTIVTLPSDAASRWEAVQTDVADVVRKQPPGVVIDCRLVAATAGDALRELLHDAVVLAKRQKRTVDICIVGRADQDMKGSAVFAMPPCFSSFEAAHEHLDARHQDGGLMRWNQRGTSEDPTAGEEPPTPVWLQVARGVGIATVLSAALGLVMYAWSAVSIDSPNRRVIPVQQFARSAGGMRVAVYGSMMVRANNIVMPDATATALLWAAAREGDALEGSFAAIASGDVKAHGFIAVRPDIDGEYAVLRSSLPDERARQFYVLVTSAVKRSGPITSEDAKVLQRFFQSPDRLLGEQAYMLRLIEVDETEPKEWNVVFKEAPPAESTPDPAPAAQSDQTE